MKEIVAKRIRSARALAGLSLRELSVLLDGMVSHNAIMKYENAEMMPDSKVLLALSNILKVKPDYFFRPFTIEINKIEFRKKSKLPQKEVKAIRERVTDTISSYIELEQFLNLAYTFENPIGKIPVSSGEDVENAVNILLEAWRIGFNALPNVIELLEAKEIKVVELEEHADFDGFSGWANDAIPVIVINKNFAIERKRFTALHELGHLLLSFDESLGQKEIERLCHRFAGAMLMPRETFLRELGNHRSSISISELVTIKESYGISIQAIMARAKNLQVITDEHFLRFRKWINREDSRDNEINFGSYRGTEHATRFKQLLYRATAENVISFSKAANMANQTVATFRDEYLAI